MTETPTAPQYRSSALSHRKPTRFDWRPEAAARAALAKALDLPAIGAFSLKGEIRPVGRHDFELEAQLVADVTQSCVISLAPVPAHIEERVLRRYIVDFVMPDGEEVEMPEDDTAEPMPEVIDLSEVAAEALALALPPYPRAAGVELGEAVFAGPGTEALRDEDLRPFAGLAQLVSKAQKGGDEGPGA